MGFKSPWGARLSGFFNQELKIAHLLIGFFLPALAFYLSKKPKKISLGLINAGIGFGGFKKYNGLNLSLIEHRF